jgi:hypothetical protein
MAVVALTLSVTPGQTSQTPTWLADYEVAQAKVADTGKPMVVVMGSGPAGLQNVVRDGADPALTRMLSDKFVCMYVDTTTPKGRETASAFQVGDRGVVISDKAGTSQAFSASGQLSRTEMMAALERHSNGQTVRYTETAGQTNGTPAGTVIQAGGQMQPGMVYQAGGPVAGTVINAGGGCGTPGMVMPVQGVAIAGPGPGYAPGGCGTPMYASGGYGRGGFGGGCCGKGMGFGFGGWGKGGGCGQQAYASGCGAPTMMAHAPMAVAPAPMAVAPAPMAVPPMAVAPAQPCAPAYAPQAAHGYGGGCGKGGFGFGGGFGGGCCFGGGFGGGWGGGFGGGFGGGCCK